MKEILEDLYGEYYIQYHRRYDSPELQMLWEEQERMEDALQEKLSGEQGEMFGQYLKLSARRQYLAHREEFADGVSLGGRLMLELLMPGLL